MGLAEKLTEIKSETNALLGFANETTGEEDTRLGDAVKRLADGYGGGGSHGMEKLFEGSFSIGSGLNNSNSANLLTVPSTVRYSALDFLIFKISPNFAESDNSYLKFATGFLFHQSAPQIVGGLGATNSFFSGSPAQNRGIYVAKINSSSGDITIGYSLSASQYIRAGSWSVSIYKYSITASGEIIF